MTEQLGLIRHCPQCRKDPLYSLTFAGSMIDICAKCKSIWLDDGELQAIVKHYGAEFRIPDASVAEACRFLDGLERSDEHLPIEEKMRSDALNCPVCGQICFPTYYGFDSGIIINHCNDGHGVFLDDGELEAILIYSARSFGLVTEISESLEVYDPPKIKLTKNLNWQNSTSRNSSSKRTPTEVLAPPVESELGASSEPRLASLRTLREPITVDVNVTISRKGNIFFHSVRSPQGDWYRVAQGGTVKIPELSSSWPHFWVELETGGALVVRQKGLHFEWILVGASAQSQKLKPPNKSN